MYRTACVLACAVSISACGSGGGGGGGGQAGAGGSGGTGAGPGTLDPSFAGGGMVDNEPGAFSYLSDMALQADGKIVCAANTPDAFDLLVVRFTPEGAVDTAFGSDGSVRVLEFTAQYDGRVIAQPDGTIVAIGEHAVETGEQDPSAFAMARLTPDGALDPSFGTEGRQIVSTSGVDVEVKEAIGGPNGSVYVLLTDYPGMSSDGTDAALIVGRVLPDGAPDPSFGESGWVTLALGAQIFPGTLVELSDGTLRVGASLAGQGLLLALNADGSRVAGFGSDGVVQVPNLGEPSKTFALYEGLAVDAQGRLILAGGYGGSSDEHQTLWRFNPDGTLDASFGGQGYIDVSGQGSRADAVAVDAAGSILTFATRSDFVTPQKYEYETVLTQYGVTGELLGELQIETLSDTEKRLSVLPDGKYLLMWGGYDGWGLARVLPFAAD